MNWDSLTPSQREFVIDELRDLLQQAMHRTKVPVRCNDDMSRDRAAAEAFAVEKAIERLEGRS